MNLLILHGLISITIVCFCLELISAEECEETQHTKTGKACYFPFTYNNRVHSRCITDGKDRPWCLLSPEYNNEDISDDSLGEKWDFCIIPTFGGSVIDGSMCYGECNYHETVENRTGTWCSTTSDSDQWGECKLPCTDVLTKRVWYEDKNASINFCEDTTAINVLHAEYGLGTRPIIDVKECTVLVTHSSMIESDRKGGQDYLNNIKRYCNWQKSCNLSEIIKFALRATYPCSNGEDLDYVKIHYKCVPELMLVVKPSDDIFKSSLCQNGATAHIKFAHHWALNKNNYNLGHITPDYLACTWDIDDPYLHRIQQNCDFKQKCENLIDTPENWKSRYSSCTIPPASRLDAIGIYYTCIKDLRAEIRKTGSQEEPTCETDTYLELQHAAVVVYECDDNNTICIEGQDRNCTRQLSDVYFIEVNHSCNWKKSCQGLHENLLSKGFWNQTLNCGGSVQVEYTLEIFYECKPALRLTSDGNTTLHTCPYPSLAEILDVKPLPSNVICNVNLTKEETSTMKLKTYHSTDAEMSTLSEVYASSTAHANIESSTVSDNSNNTVAAEISTLSPMPSESSHFTEMFSEDHTPPDVFCCTEMDISIVTNVSYVKDKCDGGQLCDILPMDDSGNSDSSNSAGFSNTCAPNVEVFYTCKTAIHKNSGEYFNDTVCFGGTMNVTNVTRGVYHNGNTSPSVQDCTFSAPDEFPQYHQKVLDACNGQNACQNLKAEPANAWDRCNKITTDYVLIEYHCDENDVTDKTDTVTVTDDYSSVSSTQPISRRQNGTDNKVLIIAASAAGGALLLIILIVIVACVTVRRKDSYDKEKQEPLQMNNVDHIRQNENPYVESGDDVPDEIPDTAYQEVREDQMQQRLRASLAVGGEYQDIDALQRKRRESELKTGKMSVGGGGMYQDIDALQKKIQAQSEQAKSNVVVKDGVVKEIVKTQPVNAPAEQPEYAEVNKPKHKKPEAKSENAEKKTENGSENLPTPEESTDDKDTRKSGNIEVPPAVPTKYMDNDDSTDKDKLSEQEGDDSTDKDKLSEQEGNDDNKHGLYDNKEPDMLNQHPVINNDGLGKTSLDASAEKLDVNKGPISEVL